MTIKTSKCCGLERSLIFHIYLRWREHMWQTGGKNMALGAWLGHRFMVSVHRVSLPPGLGAFSCKESGWTRRTLKHLGTMILWVLSILPAMEDNDYGQQQYVSSEVIKGSQYLMVHGKKRTERWWRVDEGVWKNEMWTGSIKGRVWRLYTY